MGLRNRYLYKEHSCFFVTTTCYKWIPFIQQSDAFQMIESTLEFVSKKFHVKILAYVIMPNHIHLILFFSKNNHLSDFMRDFKKFTSTQIKKRLRKTIPAKIWMERFDDVYIRDKSHLEIKLAYIHNNPIQEKWNLSKAPENYPFSSATFYFSGKQSLQLQSTHYLDIF